MVSGEWRVSRGFLSPSLSTQLIDRVPPQATCGSDLRIATIPVPSPMDNHRGLSLRPRPLISLDIAPFVRLSCLVKFTLFCSDSGKRHYSF